MSTRSTKTQIASIAYKEFYRDLEGAAQKRIGSELKGEQLWKAIAENAELFRELYKSRMETNSAHFYRKLEDMGADDWPVTIDKVLFCDALQFIGEYELPNENYPYEKRLKSWGAQFLKKYFIDSPDEYTKYFDMLINGRIIKNKKGEFSVRKAKGTRESIRQTFKDKNSGYQDTGNNSSVKDGTTYQNSIVSDIRQILPFILFEANLSSYLHNVHPIFYIVFYKKLVSEIARKEFDVDFEEVEENILRYKEIWEKKSDGVNFLFEKHFLGFYAANNMYFYNLLKEAYVSSLLKIDIESFTKGLEYLGFKKSMYVSVFLSGGFSTTVTKPNYTSESQLIDEASRDFCIKFSKEILQKFNYRLKRPY